MFVKRWNWFIFEGMISVTVWSLFNTLSRLDAIQKSIGNASELLCETVSFLSKKKNKEECWKILYVLKFSSRL